MVPRALPGPTPESNATTGRDDSELVACVRHGDLRAFETVFERYYAPLVRFARSFVRDEAEDAVQEVFLRVWAAREGWEIPAGTVAAYLFAAVRNHALNRQRHESVAQRAAAEIGDRDVGGVDFNPAVVRFTDAIVETQELAAVVRDVLAALPERCRTTYLLSREQGLSYPEIARVMGTSVHTVNAQMGRAFLALRRAVLRWRGR